MSRKIRVGIAGAGSAARAHLRALAGIPGVEVAGLAGRRPERSAALAREFSVPWLVGSPEELVRSARVDAVVLAVPPFLQPDLAVKAFRAGKHVLCEKPLAPSPGEARRVVEAWRRSGRVGMMNFCYRLIPEVVRFFKELKKGRCGRLSLITAEWSLPNRLSRELTFHWKGQREMGGGALQNFGTHVLDYLFQDGPVPRLLGARQATLTKTRPDGRGKMRGVTGDEATTALFETPDGTAVVLHLSLVTRPGEGHRVIARGDAGSLELRNADVRSPGGPFSLWRRAEGARRDTPLSARVPAGRHDLASLFSRTDRLFIKAVREGGPSPRPSLPDGLRAAVLADRIRRARPGGSAA